MCMRKEQFCSAIFFFGLHVCSFFDYCVSNSVTVHGNIYLHVSWRLNKFVNVIVR